MIKVGLDEAQSGIKIARKNINNLTYVVDTTLKQMKTCFPLPDYSK